MFRIKLSSGILLSDALSVLFCTASPKYRSVKRTAAVLWFIAIALVNMDDKCEPDTNDSSVFHGLLDYFSELATNNAISLNQEDFMKFTMIPFRKTVDIKIQPSVDRCIYCHVFVRTEGRLCSSCCIRFSLLFTAILAHKKDNRIRLLGLTLPTMLSTGEAKSCCRVCTPAARPTVDPCMLLKSLSRHEEFDQLKHLLPNCTLTEENYFWWTEQGYVRITPAGILGAAAVVQEMCPMLYNIYTALDKFALGFQVTDVHSFGAKWLVKLLRAQNLDR